MRDLIISPPAKYTFILIFIVNMIEIFIYFNFLFNIQFNNINIQKINHMVYL